MIEVLIAAIALVKKHCLALVDSNLKNGHGVEAGLALASLARRLEWSDKVPTYEQSLLHLERTKAWEEAAKVGHVLMDHWKSQFDHVQLASLLTRMGVWYGRMMDEKYSHSFFRVSFHGSGWSDVVKGQARVYKGGEWEKISAFCERLLLKFPGANLLRGASDANLTGRWLAVSSVEPITDWVNLLEHMQNDQDSFSVAHDSVEEFHKAWAQAQQGLAWQTPHLPPHMIQHYKNNQVRHFFSSVPINKKPSKGNEFLDLWTQRTLMTIDCPLPNVLTSSTIIETSVVELSPIENALEAVQGKTSELRELMDKFSKPDAGNINPLTMSLNGAVDAPVNGGINMYRKAFLSPEFVEAQPEWQDFVHRLAKAIQTQAQVIDECLSLHGRLALEAVRPLHTSLVAQFHKNFSHEITKFAARSSVEEIHRSHSIKSLNGSQKSKRSISLSGSLLASLASKLKISREDQLAQT